MQNAHFVTCKEFQILTIRQTFLPVDEFAIHDISEIKQNTTWTHARPEDRKIKAFRRRWIVDSSHIALRIKFSSSNVHFDKWAEMKLSSSTVQTWFNELKELFNDVLSSFLDGVFIKNSFHFSPAYHTRWNLFSFQVSCFNVTLKDRD